MDALKIYEDALDDLASDLITEDEFTKIIKCLRDVQEVRHGHWTNNKGGIVTDFECPVWCTVCGQWANTQTLYCPNCGAKMDEEANNGK